VQVGKEQHTLNKGDTMEFKAINERIMWKLEDAGSFINADRHGAHHGNLVIKIATQNFSLEQELLISADYEECKKIWGYAEAIIHGIWQTVIVRTYDDGTVIIKAEGDRNFALFSKSKEFGTHSAHIVIEFHNELGAAAGREFIVEE
jgi:hypothetical protein